MKNKINSITYVNPYSGSPWIAFHRNFSSGYYEINTYEREELAAAIFHKYFKLSNRNEFSFYGMKTIISMDI